MTMKQNAHRNTGKRRRGRRDRGSALLVSLMVMVGLSLLGLSFVAISETENAISVNERNKTRTTALAEAGAKAAVQWFQDPDTMKARDLLPENDFLNFKTERLSSGYKGYYKPAGNLFDTPFGPQDQDLFFGDEDHADVLIVDGRNQKSTDFLKKFNETLFYQDPNANEGPGRIVAIRVYAPPIVGGNLVNGFYVAGQRYGLATIAVTAEKRSSANAVIAQSICRVVVAPFPLPGPSGAIQAIGGIDTNGAYEVHWGSVESEQTATNTFIKREMTSFPWFDAYDRAYFEYGLDSSTVYQPGISYQSYAAPFPRGRIVRPTDPAIAAKHEYMVTATNNPHTSPNPEPVWDQTPGSEKFYGNVKFKEVTPTAYKIGTGVGTPYPGYNIHNWMAEMLRRSVEDPWFQVRTKGRIDGGSTGLGPLNDPHPADYATDPIAGAGNYTTLGLSKSHYFQYQTYDNRPLYRQVRVPRFDYDFWKAAAVTGRGQKNVFYLEWVTQNKYTNGADTKTFEEWIQAGQGFFFFDTKNKMNPQKGGPGVLVPIDANVCGARGIVYMNTSALKTTATGCTAVDAWYNQPGEPYRDIGYRKVNEASSGMQQIKGFTTDGEGNPVRDKAYNNRWDYQDLAWSNGQSAKNGVFDVCIGQRPVHRESDNTTTTEWMPLPYYPDCKVGNNMSLPTCDCSEPFEPYLNLHYTGQKANIQAYWDDPNSNSSVAAKITDNEKPTGTPVACAAGAVSTKDGQARCTTNAYDKRGALAWLNKVNNESAISVEGVVYNEGNYTSTGNTAYYGSVVVAGQVSPQGTQEIWYDACLADDCWPPKHIPFPRVMITSTQIQ
jgi:hypothetical protein